MTSQSSDITEEIERINMPDQENAGSVSAAVFIIVQKRKLVAIVAEVLCSQSTSSFSSFDDNENDDFDGHCSVSVIRFAEDVGFFNFDYADVDNFVIVNVGRHVFYRDVYVFGDKLKNFAKGFIGEQRMRELISRCLRDEVFK